MAPPNATLENPHTPMAFLEPAVATKLTNQTYAAVGSLAILLWDTLLYLPQDYKLATRYRINTSFIVYCTARVTSLTYIMGLVIMTTAPVGNCSYIRQISILYPFTIPLTLVPFVMRVFALYNNNKYVIAFFSMTWLSVLGSCIAVPIGAMGFNIGTTKYCLDGKTKVANALALFCPFIHDSLIFAATSWAFMRYSYDDVNNLTNGIRAMVLGRHLPAFSKSILRDGQFYYLITLILNLFFIVLFYKPQAAITPCTIGIPVFVTLNTMSSYCYRRMRFGYYRDDSITSSIINNALQRPGQSSSPARGLVFKKSIATKDLGIGKDLETGDASHVSKAESEEKVGELVEDVSSSRNP